MENQLDELLASFGGKTTNQNTAETVAIQVTGYILPPSGAESAENARLLGVRWDTAEAVEIALRDTKHASRPTIAQFQNDAGSSMPVTTEIGGTIIADRAYLDANLKPLSGKNVAVLNAAWLNRVSPDKNQGWALRCLARVNSPRLMTANDPTRGNTQTITLMQADKAQVINSMEELDSAVLNALDASLRDQDKAWHLRPGAVNAFVRLSNDTHNNLIELSGGFFTPEDKEHPQPKTREMVKSNLAEWPFWQTKREVLAKALANTNYKVEVIPGSTLFVGRKTVQKGMNNKANGIEGVSREIGDTTTALFTETVIGLRRSPKTGLPQVLFAKPFKNRQMATVSGEPTAEEKAMHGITNPAPTQEKAMAAPTTSTQANTIPQAQAQAQAQADNTKPIVIRPSKNQPDRLLAIANSSAQAVALEDLSRKLNGDYEPNHKIAIFRSDQLPMAIQQIKSTGHTVKVAPINPESKEKINPVEAVKEQSAPAPLEEPPRVEEPPLQTQEVDLSTLDLSNLDLDSALNTAYQDYEATLKR